MDNSLSEPFIHKGSEGICERLKFTFNHMECVAITLDN